MAIKAEELINSITEKDIPEQYEPVIELIGIKNYIKLCQHCMGEALYFPTLDRFLMNVRNRLILEEYTGYNVSELSNKYGLTKNQIRSIVKRPNTA